MASNGNSPHGERTMETDIADLTKLISERRKLTIEVAGSPCTSPPSTSPLLQKLQETCNGLVGNRCSPRTTTPGICFGRGAIPSNSYRGVSPSQSAGSDSSISGSARGSVPVNSRNFERTNLTTLGSNLAHATLVGSNYRRGSTSNPIPGRGTQPRVGRVGVPVIPNSSNTGQMLPTAAGRGSGRNELAPPTSTGAAPAKGTKKRKRPSKKLPTTVIPATVDTFRFTVQNLTGLKAPPVQPPAEAPAQLVRPQPGRPQPAERPQAYNVVSSDVELHRCDPPARPDPSSISMMGAGCSPARAVSDRAPDATFSILESSSSSRYADLNDCMGYGENTPLFLDYDENLGLLPENTAQTASDSVYGDPSELRHYKGHEVSTSTEARVNEAAPHSSESNRSEVQREQTHISHDSGSGSFIDDICRLGHRQIKDLDSTMESEIVSEEWLEILELCNWQGNTLSYPSNC